MASVVVGVLVAGLLSWLVLRDDTYVAQPRDPDATQASPAAAAATLHALEEAVRAGDVDGAEALAPDGDDDARTLLGAVVDNARAARVGDFTLRYVDETGAVDADGRWSAAVDTTWAFERFDDVPARAEVRFTFETVGEEARLVGIGGGGRRSPIWMTGPAEVRRTSRTLVVVADGGADVDALDRVVRRAVPTVLKVIPGWTGGLVVEVPRSVAALHTALAADAGTYDAIAAVTTTVDGTLTDDAPVHVFVNPRVFAGLKPAGAQVVMSHEATHVATGAATSAMPLWLLEGFADYVALRDVPLPLSTTAGQIIRQVRNQGVPDHLPGPDEFDTRATHLGASYESAWLACRVLAGIGGEELLVQLYDRVEAGADVDAALRRTYGFGEDELTARWRDYLRGIA